MRRVPPVARSASRTRRLSLAVAGSAALHLLAALAVAPAVRTGAREAEPRPLTARLVPPAVADAPPDGRDGQRAGTREPARAPAPAAGARGLAAPPPTRTAPAGRSVPAPTPDADPVFYAATELDEYPRLAAPLPHALRAGTRASARFELFIDEHGIVQRVEAAAGRPGTHASAGWSAALATMRFVPARRGGRAVKSRVVITFGAAASGR